MILLLGPDNSGKSTLAKAIADRSRGTSNEHVVWKALASTGYKDYMRFLRGEKSKALDIGTYRPGLALQRGGQVVADRFFYCELPYARILRNSDRIQWSLKQWHNMHLSTIPFYPIVVLTTRKAPGYADSVPEILFDPILQEYKYWLRQHNIGYRIYDYEQFDVNEYADELLQYSMFKKARVQWWLDMAEKGLAGVGNTVDPTVFIMAQDMGPSNVHRVPFEQGPSGYYLSELIDQIQAPLNSFYITNWKKTLDRAQNVDLLRTELTHTMPKHIILLGREATDALPVIAEYPAAIVHKIVHPGWVVNHSGSLPVLKRRKERFWEEWVKIWEDTGVLAATTGRLAS